MVAKLGYCNATIPKVQTRLGIKGSLRYILRFHTYTYTSLNSLHDDWYNNGIKRVPVNIAEFLTPLALAVLIMDDGTRIRSGLKLCTNSFTYEDCKRLSSILFDKYQLKVTVQSAGVPNQYNIYIKTNSMSLLRNMVRPYMVSSMLYKLGE